MKYFDGMLDQEGSYQGEVVLAGGCAGKCRECHESSTARFISIRLDIAVTGNMASVHQIVITVHVKEALVCDSIEFHLSR